MQEQDLEYAGFRIRIWATIIDTILLMLITFPLLVSIYGWDYLDAEKTGFIAGPEDCLISWVLPAIAVITFWIYRAATPGKMAIIRKNSCWTDRWESINKSACWQILRLLYSRNTIRTGYYLDRI